jgi:hypothetical protein
MKQYSHNRAQGTWNDHIAYYETNVSYGWQYQTIVVTGTSSKIIEK